MDHPPPAPGPFLKRVRILNWKSIAHCDVELGPLTVLVGRNGSGKSNFLDAIRLLPESLKTPYEFANFLRDGFQPVFNKHSREREFNIILDLVLLSGREAVYEVEIGGRPGTRAVGVLKERLEVAARGQDPAAWYRLEGGRLSHSPGLILPPASPDRLFLGNAAGLPQFSDVYDALLGTRVYRFDLEEIKSLQRTGSGAMLQSDGANISDVIGRIETERPSVMERINAFLEAIVPGVAGAQRVSSDDGDWEYLKFTQTLADSPVRKSYFAGSMSDGTLRALATLVAVAQLAEGGRPVSLVGVEEPETALHPAAVAALVDALREAAVRTQVIVTTHSPDLLDLIDPETDCLLAVQMRDGVTEIGPINRASREAVREHLYSPGELLRMDQLEPDRACRPSQESMPDVAATAE